MNWPERQPQRRPDAKQKQPPLAIAPFNAATAKKHQQAWADCLGVPVEITNSIGMKLVLIPPGEFDMGLTQADIDHELATIENQESWTAEQIRGIGPQHRASHVSRSSYVSTYFSDRIHAVARESAYSFQR
jgi:hypothetical protein